MAQLTRDEWGVWRDVGHEIVEKMEDVCKSMYGDSSDWKDKVCKTSIGVKPKTASSCFDSSDMRLTYYRSLYPLHIRSCLSFMNRYQVQLCTCAHRYHYLDR